MAIDKTEKLDKIYTCKPHTLYVNPTKQSGKECQN